MIFKYPTENKYTPIDKPSSVQTFNLLNCNVGKKFFNYFLNNSTVNSPNSSRLNSGRKNDVAMEYQNKFNENIYLKYLKINF
jgi:hypothetical protein